MALPYLFTSDIQISLQHSWNFEGQKKTCDIIISGSHGSGLGICYIFEHLTSPKFL
jgi:hypothetical protein